jgi:osmotically-inducible protein OsmY
MSDMQLRQNIIDELEFVPSVDSAHIGIAAERGVVTLTGHVSNYAQKESALAAAHRIKGVKAIADEIEVRYVNGRTTADDEIAKRAVDMLGWDTVLPSESIQVTVRDGFVNLAGAVEWQYQKKAAEDDVRRLSGVRGLINSITIKPRVTTFDIKNKIEQALKRHAEVEADAVRITVKNGNEVLLEGNVDNWKERYAVETAAWSAPGVMSVDDRLVVG